MLDGLLGNVLASLTGGRSRESVRPGHDWQDAQSEQQLEKRRRLDKQQTLALVLHSPKGNERSLRLENMELEQAPDLIWERWSHIHHLDLSQNRNFDTLISPLGLTRIPRRLRRMRRLQRLSLGSNQLRELPEEIGLLGNLHWIDLTHNQLSSLPEGFGLLKRLTSLGASDCQFTHFPLSICRLTQLKKLGFFANLVSELPPAIGDLRQLTKLDLSGNRLIRLPAEIGQLTQLTWLNLSNNRLEELPPQITQLINLEELGLSGNRLTRLPDLSNLQALTLLPAFNNRLEVLGEWIGKLPQLSQLDVSNNQLTELPASIWNSPALTFINVRANRLTQLPEYRGPGANEADHPELFVRGCHPQVQVIDVRENQLAWLPWGLLGPHLIELKVAGNPWQLEIQQATLDHVSVSLFARLALHEACREEAPPPHVQSRIDQMQTNSCAACLGKFVHTPRWRLEPRESTDGHIVPFRVNLCSGRCEARFEAEIEEKMRLAEELLAAMDDMEMSDGELQTRPREEQQLLNAHYGPVADASDPMSDE